MTRPRLSEQDLTLEMVPDSSLEKEKFFNLAYVGAPGYSKIASLDEREALWNKDSYESLGEALTLLCLLARGVNWGLAYPFEGEHLRKAEKALDYVRVELAKKQS